ncbi:hypothetical protein GW17_00001102 [Ensete ventricosum]|nr:hypothetical protein GW17_00001102 [Ensete ventricosum]RZR84393.1 hypothetical protein BHM03_00011226 [Ensete ventricosum]
MPALLFNIKIRGTVLEVTICLHDCDQLILHTSVRCLARLVPNSLLIGRDSNSIDSDRRGNHEAVFPDSLRAALFIEPTFDRRVMPAGGILNALYAFHSHDIPRGLLATTFLLVVFNCLSSFQIYSMPVFDSFEAGYTSRTNRPCSVWVRSGFRVFYGFISFFIGVALPFLSSLAGLLGGLTLPVTFAYPCFMWIRIKKPERFSFNWYLNWSLGIMGVAFSLAFSMGGVWSMVNSGLKLKFFKPN